MHISSKTVPGLVWTGQSIENDEDWIATWQGKTYKDETSLLADIQKPSPEVQAEILVGFRLGLDDFVPVMDIDAWYSQDGINDPRAHKDFRAKFFCNPRVMDGQLQFILYHTPSENTFFMTYRNDSLLVDLPVMSPITAYAS